MHYSALACSGKALLAPFGARSALRTPSGVVTRSGLLLDSMEANHFLPLALRRASLVRDCPDAPSARRISRWAHQLNRVPGFCYLKLFKRDWYVPAIATLGPYPEAADVACLSQFFRAGQWGIYYSHSRSSRRVAHVSGSAHPVAYLPSARLQDLAGCVVGSLPPGSPFPGPPFPTCSIPPPRVGPSRSASRGGPPVVVPPLAPLATTSPPGLPSPSGASLTPPAVRPVAAMGTAAMALAAATPPS